MPALKRLILLFNKFPNHVKDHLSEKWPHPIIVEAIG
jgi:hypothetical protein